MKILLVQISDHLSGGGGAIAAYRLHQGLRQAGVDSKILCARKTLSSDDSVALPPMSRLEGHLRAITRRLGLNDIHSVRSFHIPAMNAYKEADILHYHGFRSRFSYLALPRLTRDKPSIYTLHDMWPFTGHCAFAYDCERWKAGCGKCPYLDGMPAVRRDATHIEWKLKEWVYSRSNLTIVSLCTQATRQARQSMLSRFPIHQIPNGIDTKVYQPLDPERCRYVLGIPQGKKVIMFAALDLTSRQKGADFMLEAVRGLPETLKAETTLLLMGTKGESLARSAHMQTISVGYVSGGRLGAAAYSAADIVVSPSRAEAFGLVSLESMACGTPAVAFGVGGAPDYIRPGVTGYLAEPEESGDLRKGIVQLLEDDTLRHAMGRRAREVVEKEYSIELIVERHLGLYQQMLQKEQPGPLEG
jgi:glycosyltransferase involved in cell wall biosynthesis